MKKTKKGFTLTELIIVIVIIGILAAVLIPSVSGYVKKAKIAKGVAEAKSMSTVVAAEGIFQNREYFQPYEITRLLKEYDFTLESTMSDYRYWYDASRNEIKFLSMDDVFGTSASGTFTQDCIEALSPANPQYRYVDSYDDSLTQLVYTVNNLVSESLGTKKSSELTTSAEKIKVLDEMDSRLNAAILALNNLKIDGFSGDNKTSIINYAASFNTTDTVYIDDNLMFNRAYMTEKNDLESLAAKSSNVNFTNDVVSIELSHVVFENEIDKIPAVQEVASDLTFEVIINTAFEIPDTVDSIQNYAFTNVILAAGIVVKDTLIQDPNSFSDAAKNAIVERTSNVNFVTLYYGTDFNISYNSAEAKLNDGTTVKYSTLSADGKSYKEFDLEKICYDGNSMVVGDNENENVICKYLVPNITFTNSKFSFMDINKVIIRRSLLENICTYSAVIVDDDLKCYKVESFGYITDIDWNIEQDFISGSINNRKIGATEATVKITLPSYVYNYVNYKGACIEVVLLPQVIKAKETQTLASGSVDVYDGVALSSTPIKIYIEEGIYDPDNNVYVYEKVIKNLNQYTIDSDQGKLTCNQLAISQISIYNEQAGSSEKDYLFIRYYK